MDRRSSLGVLLGRSATLHRSERRSSGFGGGLSPYAGPWDAAAATHLLRRACFGPTPQEVTQAVGLGLEGTLDALFAAQPMPDPPINYFNANDVNVPIGQTWIEAPYTAGLPERPSRMASLNAWTVGLLLRSGMNLREKMTLFWHNHFVTARAELNDPKYQYVYISLLREFATGNFRELTKRITVDPSMLIYLNGNLSTKNNPNENYARELLELFTIGKGPQAGPGDYTNYTEDDVLAMARVLTGWITTGFGTLNPDIPVGSEFRITRHAIGSKTLSHRFGKHVITNLGDQEYAHLIDIIFGKPECARFIARKLYRWFAYYEIDAAVEAEVIEPMAQLILQHDYEIAPALRALLASEHFYSDCLRGVMIKHPVDFTISLLRQGGWVAPGILTNQYRYWSAIFPAFTLLQMEYFNPPGVAGWKAWYQDPAWYQSWINSVTLPLRSSLVKLVVVNGIKVGVQPPVPIPVLDWVKKLPDPTQPDEVIEGFVQWLFPKPVSEAKKAYLKEVLLPGLPDYEWTVEYLDHLANPGNTDLANAVANKLRNLVSTMMQMPEYQLS